MNNQKPFIYNKKIRELFIFFYRYIQDSKDISEDSDQYLDDLHLFWLNYDISRDYIFFDPVKRLSNNIKPISKLSQKYWNEYLLYVNGYETRQILIDLSKAFYFSPFTICKIENIYRITRRQIFDTLDIESENFVIDYNAIIIGTYILSCTIEQRKYCKNRPIFYPLTLQEISDTCNFTQLNLNDDIEIDKIIKNIGYSALNEVLPFQLDFIEQFPHHKKLNLRQKLKNTYFPNECPLPKNRFEWPIDICVFI